MPILSVSPQFQDVQLPSPQPLGLLIAPSQARINQRQSIRSPQKQVGTTGEFLPEDEFNIGYSKQILELDRQNFMGNLAREASESGDMSRFLLYGEGRERMQAFDRQYQERLLRVESLEKGLKERATDVFGMMDTLQERGVTENDQWYDDQGNPVEGMTVGHKMFDVLNASNVTEDERGIPRLLPQQNIVVPDVDAYYAKLDEFLVRASEDDNQESITDTTIQPMIDNSTGEFIIGGKKTTETSLSAPGLKRKGKSIEIHPFKNKENLSAAYAKFMLSVGDDATLSKTHNVLQKRLEKIYNLEDKSDEEKRQTMQDHFNNVTIRDRLKSSVKRSTDTTRDFTDTGEADGTGGDGGGAPNTYAALLLNDQSVLGGYDEQKIRMDGSYDFVKSSVQKTGAYTTEELITARNIMGSEGQPGAFDMVFAVPDNVVKQDFGLSDQQMNRLMSLKTEFINEAKQLQTRFPGWYEPAVKDLEDHYKNMAVLEMMGKDRREQFLIKNSAIYEGDNLRFDPETETYDVVVNGAVIDKVAKETVVPGAKISVKADTDTDFISRTLGSLRKAGEQVASIIPGIDIESSSTVTEDGIDINVGDDNWTVSDPFFLSNEHIRYSNEVPAYPTDNDTDINSFFYMQPANKIGRLYIHGEPVDVSTLIFDNNKEPIIVSMDKVMPYAKFGEEWLPGAELTVMIPDTKEARKAIQFTLSGIEDGKIAPVRKSLNDYTSSKGMSQLRILEGKIKDLLNKHQIARLEGYDEDDEVLLFRSIGEYRALPVDARKKNPNVDFFTKEIDQYINSFQRNADEDKTLFNYATGNAEPAGSTDTN